jgi:adenine deaminase
VNEGHMDRVVRHAIEQGIAPMTVLQMATINTAEYFNVSRDLGMIAPGRYADLLLVKDLENFMPELVLSKGQVLAENGKCSVKLPLMEYPDWVMHSVHIPKPLKPADFALKIPAGINSQKMTANVIGIIENQAPTRHLRIPMETSGGEVKAVIKKDIAKVAIIERHHNTGAIQLGLVHGFGFLASCAVASTVAHDCHHLIVIGTDDSAMAIAANALADMGGGQIVVKDGKIIGKVDLKIAGLMSNEPASAIAKKVATVLDGFVACGCKLHNPNMQLSLLALVVIPELRISNLGLVNVDQFDFIPVFE